MGQPQLTLANNLKPDDCLIAISYSGQSNIANIAVKRAKELNCPSIAICQSCKSNMAQKSTVPIFVPKLEQERKIGSIASRLSCTIVTDILYLGTIQSELDTVTKNVSQARKLLSSLKQKKLLKLAKHPQLRMLFFFIISAYITTLTLNVPGSLAFFIASSIFSNG